MAEFLTTNGTSYHIENIIKEAKKKLVLVSPYLKISPNFYDRLNDATKKGVAITIVYGKNELQPEEMTKLKSLKDTQLYFLSNLHAKVYFNESKMVITSMNMYEFSEKNNREMGVLIDKVNDTVMFNKAVEEVKSFVDASQKANSSVQDTSQKVNFQSTSTNIKPQQKTDPSKGYCIRCETKITFNPEKPLCFNCFNTWAQFENWDYIENVCHKCGKDHDSSMRYPLDRNCYNVLRNTPDPNSVWSSLGRLFAKL